jgi:hypothetical protein
MGMGTGMAKSTHGLPMVITNWTLSGLQGIQVESIESKQNPWSLSRLSEIFVGAHKMIMATLRIKPKTLH